MVEVVVQVDGDADSDDGVGDDADQDTRAAISAGGMDYDDGVSVAVCVSAEACCAGCWRCRVVLLCVALVLLCVPPSNTSSLLLHRMMVVGGVAVRLLAIALWCILVQV